jgi:hypothetical protein
MKDDMPREDYSDMPEKKEYKGVIDDLEVVDNSLSFLDNELAILEKYLSPILKLLQENEIEELPEALENGRSQLSSRIMGMDRTIRKIALRVREIRSRVDV